MCNQFVTGLLPDIKIKVAGTEGSFETLLTKARFEETKFRDLGKGEPVLGRRQNLRFHVGGGRQFPFNTVVVNPYLTPAVGYIANNCPLKGRRSRKVRGQTSNQTFLVTT